MLGLPASVTLGMIDQSPTVVTLGGDAGDLVEGGSKAVTVSIGRGLAAGEILTVPLVLRGTATIGSDYTLTGIAAAGVSFQNLNSANASVVFTGPSSGVTAAAATLTLVAIADGEPEDVAETVDIAIGTLVPTGLGGGAESADNLATFAMSDVPEELPLEVSVAPDMLSVVEGGTTGSYTLVLEGPPAADITVTATSAAPDKVQVHALGGSPGESTTLTFTTTDWAEPQTVVVTAQLDDGASDEMVDITHTAGAEALADALVTVFVDDERVAQAQTPVVSIAGSDATISEGESASFTVTASPAPARPIEVIVELAEIGSFVAVGQLQARTLTIDSSGTASFEVATADDAARESKGAIRAIIEAGDGYDVSRTDGYASVLVNDNDDLTTVSIADASAQEGAHVVFEVSLSRAVNRQVTVLWQTESGTGDGAALAGSDFVQGSGRAIFAPGSTTQEVSIATIEDSVDEGRESFTLTLTEAEGGSIEDGTAIGAIDNTDPMPAAWLGRFGRAVAEQALDGIAGRLEAPRTAGTEGNMAGFSLAEGLGQFTEGSAAFAPASNMGAMGGAMDAGEMQALGSRMDVRAQRSAGTRREGTRRVEPDSDGASQDDRDSPRMPGSTSLGDMFDGMLLGSQFTVTRDEDLHGGSLAFWGRGSRTTFSGQAEALQMDGEVTTAMLGSDYARNNWLAGVALTRSVGDGDYRDSAGGIDIDGGSLETTLTAVIPYAAWQPSDRLKVWSAIGYGSGESTLESGTADSVGTAINADIGWRMAAAGLRSDLSVPKWMGAFRVALKSDALWAETSSERAVGAVATDAGIHRLRIGLEAARQFEIAGSSLVPTLEIGARRDGGDAENGLGVDIGGGLSWSVPRFGLALDVRGRTLIAHEDSGMEETGFSASLAYDPVPASALGLSFKLSQDIGGAASNGGLDALFASESIARQGYGSSMGGDGRWTAEASYGLSAFDGKYVGTPHLNLATSLGSRDMGIGWRFGPGEEGEGRQFNLSLLAGRRESLSTPPEHSLGFEFQARW